MITIEQDVYTLCLKIATKAHEGQFRHDGVTPYIEHPKDVSRQFTSIRDKSVAILHDTVEDTDLTLDELRDLFKKADPEFKFLQLFADILWGVDMLTHIDGQTYKEYVKSIQGFPLQIKIMDIVCNLADSPSDYQKAKYKKAMKILLKVDIRI